MNKKGETLPAIGAKDDDYFYHTFYVDVEAGMVTPVEVEFTKLQSTGRVRRLVSVEPKGNFIEMIYRTKNEPVIKLALRVKPVEPIPYQRIEAMSYYQPGEEK